MAKKFSQFAVLGLGRFGVSIVKTLANHGFDVLACDIDRDAVQAISEYATHAIQIDFADEKSMQTLGLGNFDVVIVAVGGNMQASIIATLMAKEMGAKHIIAKALTEKHRTILEKIGADRVLLPEWEMGVITATSLIASHMIDYINLSDEYSIAEMNPPEEWVGIPLKQLELRSSYGISIAAIKRENDIIVPPMATDIIQENDILVVLGKLETLQKINTIIKLKPRIGGAV